MKIELLHQVLEGEKGITKEGKEGKKDGRIEYQVSDEAELTLMLDMGHEVLTVNRIKRVALQPELLLLETHKGERFYLGPDAAVRAVKFAEGAPGQVRNAGFGR